MSPGDLEFVQLLLSWAVTGPMVVAVVRLDERRLRGACLARAWPPVSRDAAIFTIWMLGFHPLCLLAFYLVHFGRTRWSARGLTLGLAWTIFTVAGALWAQVIAAVAIEGMDALDA
jgi:hypothetical protein